MRCAAKPRPSGRTNLASALEGNRLSIPVLAQVIGYRRFPFEAALIRTLLQEPAEGRSQLAWAVGRVGSAASVPALRPLLKDPDDRVCEAAAVALMRLGDDRFVQWVSKAAAELSWARRVLPIGGDSRSVRVLLDALEHAQDITAQDVLAVGLLGDLAGIAPLLGLLQHEQLGESAAVALNTITGASLFADVFVLDELDRDELFDEERDQVADGRPLTAPDVPPAGNWERRPARDREMWRSWLDENKHRFDRGMRWRMGKPYGPAALFECLKAGTTSTRSARYV